MFLIIIKMKNPGIYLAVLIIVIIAAFSCKKETDSQPPVASFTCDKTSGDIPLTINFVSTSTGNITNYSWDFGDGGSSSLQNPTHTYTNPGSFIATLTVTGPGGNNSNNKTITVSEAAPVADFTCDKITGDAPLTINFTSTSTGNITNYSWDFGDGGISSDQNPSHTYTDPGSYTATLTVTGPGGNNSANQTITANEVIITDVTFYNPAFTDIQITFNGTTNTLIPGDSFTFDDVPGSSAPLYAYTYGSTTTGTQIGLKIEWDEIITLNGGTVSYNLNVSSTYFYIYIKNSGTHTLINLYVNYGLPSQTYDNISIPNNSVKYKIGYYTALSNSNVRMYFQDNLSYYVYWNQGTQFILPWTENQYVNLLNTNQSTSFDKSDISEGPILYPALTDHYDKNPKAIDLYSK